MVNRTLGLLCFLFILDLAFSQLVCPTGKWGTACDQDCDANCILNCEKEKGTCYGCKPGWYDRHCDHACPDCKFGCDQNTGLCECDVYGCKTCNPNNPAQCDICDATLNFIHNINAPERCCSEGCERQFGGVVDCHDDGVCALDDCDTNNYWGEKCTKCSKTIEHCDSCALLQNTDTLICVKCWTDYEISSDQKRCCPTGCDDCQTIEIQGVETDICSVCKTGYYIYGEKCDTCGGNCQPPDAGPPESRCDPVSGDCLYGCLSDWHGSMCNVLCDLANCETCRYDEPNLTLTCQTCTDGWAPNPGTGLCEQCNANCLEGRCDPETGFCTNGCIDGWRWDRCDETCADAGLRNCTVCGRDTDTCSQCMFNNWGPVCEYECSENCEPVQGNVILNHICDKDTAACNAECRPGFWREDCREECPNCLNDTCRINDGRCTENACKPGFWDRDCQIPCSPYCAPNPALNEQECDFKDGFCTHGCTYNTFGHKCEQACNANCYDNRTEAAILADEPLCTQDNGDCMYGCERGFYTIDCSKPCESTCVTGVCGRQEGFCPACDEVPKGWLCYDGACPVGKHGQFCQSNCSGGDYCLDRFCNRFNGDCDACVKARWGEDCQFECRACADDVCDQANGICTLGCVDGTWGQRCENTCHERCEVCDRDSGQCVRCDAGKFGTVCERNCSENCLPSKDDIIRCNKDSGHCDEVACSGGYYSLTCNSMCNPNCAGNENGTVDCEINTGECLYNCKDGWFGPLCTGECLDSCRGKRCVERSDNCVDGCSDFYYGDRCQSQCNDGCRNRKCDDFGFCTEGCENERFGEMCDSNCNETCIDAACDRNSGRCEYCYNFTADNFHMCKGATCKIGKYGTYCNMTCPGGDKCLDNTCDRYTAFCDGCVTSRWGDSCENNCSTCLDGICDQNNGVCTKACIDGYFGQNCLDTCMNRCNKCDRIDGSCIVCSEGYYGPVCELNCSAHCALTNGKLLCDKGNGKCSSGACAPGYFGLKCEDGCYDHCLATNDNAIATCDYNTGYCTHGCERGWYGLLCTGECSTTCRNKNCFEDSNNCLDGCTDDYWGPKCLQECSRGCNLGKCDDFGVCLAGCVENRYGPTCSETCITTCIDSFCDQQTGNCSECTKQEPSILCRTALCEQGLYGLRCDMPCPSTLCLDNRCNRNNGMCEGCNIGLYGAYCRSECPNCINGACDQDSGKCLEECLDGWYGERCDMRCESCVRCSQSSGLCTTCPAEKYGNLCQDNCSKTCLPTKDGYKSCDIYTAACASLACVNGFYGPDCITPCHSNCGTNNDGFVLCDFASGSCSANCTNLFYGPHCEKDCESYCHDKTCHRVEGICSDCKPIQGCPDCLLPPNCPDALCNTGFWGQTCRDPCPQRCDSRGCDRYTAKCVNCQPGFYGDKCAQICKFQGCYTCAQSTGLCESCNAGKYGINCDIDCGGCAPVNGEVRCDQLTGGCLTDVCQPGNWGIYCADECNTNCADSDGHNICDKLSGECLLGCDISYFGADCDQECSPKCRNKNCKDSANNCQEGCALGYFGLPSCLTECNIHCINNNCDEVGGFCNEGCQEGYYLDQCSERCKETCTNNKCDRNTGRCPECTMTTNNPYYFCRTKECEAGKRGNLCEKFCHEHCAEKCDRYTGKCDGCDFSYFGANCTLECPNCVNSLCNQDTGVCDQGCQAGYFNPYCAQPCIFDGCETCDREFGLCLTCKVRDKIGLFGTACEKNCSSYCTPSVDGDHLCDKETGVCREGSCLPGWWGLDCVEECNINCKENEFGFRSCYYGDGICSSGCKDYFWGDQCDKNCSERCIDILCDRDSNCLVDCVRGAYGPSCEFDCKETCNDGTCDRDFGNCTECNKPLDQQTELCRSAPCQIPGKAGVYCNISCPKYCESRCDRNIYTCDACQDTWWGDNCTQTCGNCKTGQCFQNNGTCQTSCEEGFWGAMCLLNCSYPGCYACERYTGECSVCNPNLWGLSCDVICSPACPPAEDGKVYCNKLTGACDVGTCAVGYYGKDCTKECSSTCISNVCDFESGTCTIGCLSGWWNPFCNQTCSNTCVQNKCTRDGQCDLHLGCVDGYAGFDCSKPCDETCIDGKCDRDLARCFECTKEPPEERDYTCRTAACPLGLQGLFCDEPCPNGCQDTCHRYNSTCDGCKSGYYGDHCNVTCGNCFEESCGQQTGNCDNGCLDEWYGLQCLKSCTDPNCQTCDIITGTCLECKPTYYGFDCSKMCSSFCAPVVGTGDVRCDRETGFCSAGQCQPGYYRQDCNTSCNANCGADFNVKRPCDILTGKCQYDCVTGWYGDTCDRQCSQQCAEGVCNRTGFCLGDLDRACKPGYYGGDCRLSCSEPQTCNDGRCHRFNGFCAACEEPAKAPECRDAACPEGTWGLFCKQTCPPNCRDGVCIRETGLCKDCINKWYGDDCNSQCLYCKDDFCFQSTGNCIRDCKDGWYTSTCNTPCLYPGCQDCTRDNGTCVDCKVGKYKADCSGDCSPYCAPTDNGLECIKSSGICKSGKCNTGYWRETCREECSPYCDTDGCELTSGACSPCKTGWFGITCRQKCSVNCKNENCEGTYDNCLEGCKEGFWGPTCESECNQNCIQNLCDIHTGECSIGCKGDMFYGPTCKEPCNGNCATVNRESGGQCERTGYCRFDCVKGTYGDKCENTCPAAAACTDGTCHRKNGNCSECDAIDPGPLCPSAACPSGKWGRLNCQEDCSSSTCLYNRCTRDDGICVGCPIGLTGSQCDKMCGKCKVGTGCNQMSGVCDEGCMNGFQGDKCDQACAAFCQSCARYGDPDNCVTCIENRWGAKCQETCNANCAKTIEGSQAVTRCDKDNGRCSEGACEDNRFWKNNCSEECPQHCQSDINGVRTCRINDGTCDKGCQNTYFGLQCTKECSVQCKNKICLNSANNCIDGCAPGFYNPPTCSGTCSAWCKNPGNVPGQEICSPNTGSCIYGCVNGYFGDRCIDQCYGKCKDGTCDDLGGCPDCRISPVGDNCHPQVCPSLKYGPSCESDCPGLYCLDDMCHRQTGKCPQGCQEWFHGEYCTERCICSRAGTQTCDQDGACVCKAGYTSVDCSQSCSDGCQNNLCDKNGQCTLGCISGRYGAQCDGRCSNCVDESCNPSTGECLISCKPGYFGTRCEDACADNCLSCQSEAACTECVSFRYGLPTCTQTCSAKCRSPVSGRVCSETSGACIEGCVNGYYGNQCDRQCEYCGGNGMCSTDGVCLDGCRSGYFHSKCDAECSVGCARGGLNNARECDITSGACQYGCQSGYYGSTCLECSSTCLGGKCSSATVCTDGCEDFWYGKDNGCSSECSNCKNGKCNDEGTCQVGCQDTFYGTKCEKHCTKTCKDDTCDQVSGECADCSTSPVGSLCRDIDIQALPQVEVDERLSMGAIIGISAGCAVAVVIIVILMVCCVFYRRQATDAKSELHLPSDVIDKLSTHRSHHSTISSQYPVARVVGDDEKDFVLF